jgi:death-on-curing protein
VNYPLKIGQPRFLTLDEVLTLHKASLDAYGGADGILDRGKLDASLAMPQQGLGGEYAHEFPFGMAAAYGYHLAMNHAFRDGNKRTAFAAMVVFLRMNGWSFELADAGAAQLSA